MISVDQLIRSSLESVLVPLRTTASIPPRTANIAELCAASTPGGTWSVSYLRDCTSIQNFLCHMVTAIVELDNSVVLTASLPLILVRSVEELLECRVLWTIS